jgi:hypothetical protein
MRRTVFQLIAGTVLLVFGVSLAAAQDRDRDDSWYQSRESFYREQHWKAHFFNRVREDLDRVQSTTFPGTGDEFRINRTKQELNELQEKMAAGRYDQPELDEVIAALQRVVESNKLSARDRDVLSDDLTRLRDYREHHANWER